MSRRGLVAQTLQMNSWIVATSQDLRPPRKMSKKSHFDMRLKEVILNVYKYETQKKSLTTAADDIVEEVALKIGICKRSVYKVVREYRARHSFAALLTNQNRKRCIHLVNHGNTSTIRRKVHQFFFRNELPTIDNVLKEVND
ncbi:unnamed protein product, partial [Callosobruchus maculatus]